MFDIGDIEALRLFSESESRSLSSVSKKGVAATEISYIVEGVPCDVTVGFETTRRFEGVVHTASAYVFLEAGEDFLGCAHKQVTHPSEAPTALNAAIEEAIREAKRHPKIQGAV